MHDATDMDLLRQYAAGNSEAAFAELVARHVNLVYSAALRKTGNPHAAEEITQAVFIILAQKSGRISDKTILPGWLYQTTRLTSANFLKGEIRRAHREQEAYMQIQPNAAAPPDETWEQIAPLLEDAMGQLGEQDRGAVVLRFFGGKSFAEVGTAAGVSKNAAKKRVNRALEKMHRYFSKRGVSSTMTVIAGAISANSVQAAPVALAKSVTAVAIAKGAVAGGSTLTLVKGALKIMAWTKAKTVIVVGTVLILATGTTTTILIERGKRVAKQHLTASNLPTLTQSEMLDVQADGTIRYQMDMDAINAGNRPLTSYHFNNSDFVHLDRITGAAGQSIAFTTQHSGKMFRYAVTFNPPIPPGGKTTASMEGTMTGLIQPTGEPGVFEYSMDHSPGYNGNTRRIEVHDLPPGAALLEMTPNDLLVTTNGDQIELQIDRIIPPGGSLAVRYRYRLAAK